MLRLREGCVRVTQDHLRLFVMLRPWSDANAYSRLNAAFTENKWACHFVPNRFGGQNCAFEIADVFDQYCKLITAQARDRVPVWNKRPKTCGYLDQQFVADRVAKAVVDQFEPVKIEIANCKTYVGGSLGISKSDLKSFEKKGPIWQSR